MSQPRTEEEWAQHDATARAAGPAENVVSTACWSCGVRFAVLATLKHDGWWHLRCTQCGKRARGELK